MVSSSSVVSHDTVRCAADVLQWGVAKCGKVRSVQLENALLRPQDMVQVKSEGADKSNTKQLPVKTQYPEQPSMDLYLSLNVKHQPQAFAETGEFMK